MAKLSDRETDHQKNKREVAHALIRESFSFRRLLCPTSQMAQDELIEWINQGSITSLMAAYSFTHNVPLPHVWAEFALRDIVIACLASAHADPFNVWYDACVHHIRHRITNQN